MAARLNPAFSRPPEIIDLRRLTARDLGPLLEEETAAWRDEMEWDFAKSAELVRRFVDLRALNGSALIEDGEVAGYSYYVLEDSKALIGDVYVRRASRTVARQNALLRQSLISLREADCRSASLTVTAANEDAVALYERVGFRTVRRFPAYVWEGF